MELFSIAVVLLLLFEKASYSLLLKLAYYQFESSTNPQNKQNNEMLCHYFGKFLKFSIQQTYLLMKGKNEDGIEPNYYSKFAREMPTIYYALI